MSRFRFDFWVVHRTSHNYLLCIDSYGNQIRWKLSIPNAVFWRYGRQIGAYALTLFYHLRQVNLFAHFINFMMEKLTFKYCISSHTMIFIWVVVDPLVWKFNNPSFSNPNRANVCTAFASTIIETFCLVLMRIGFRAQTQSINCNNITIAIRGKDVIIFFWILARALLVKKKEAWASDGVR